MTVSAGALPGVTLGLALGFAASTALADAPVYTLIPAESSLTFAGTQQGEKFTGAFRDYDATIAYAANQLPSSRLDVTVRLKSLDSRNQERDESLAGADWFDFARYPSATFKSASFRAAATGGVADAELTIKGRVKKLAFPFTWQVGAGRATLDARVSIDRLDFGVGAGEWADESIVGRKVEVIVHAVFALSRPPPAAPAAAPTKPAVKRAATKRPH